jgi:hypothetical protein
MLDCEWCWSVCMLVLLPDGGVAWLPGGEG